jgi:hypothetical protein
MQKMQQSGVIKVRQTLKIEKCGYFTLMKDKFFASIILVLNLKKFTSLLQFISLVMRVENSS